MGMSEKNDVVVYVFFFFQNIWNFLILVKTMIYPKHNLANSSFLEVKGTDKARKWGQPLKRLKLPR